MERRFLKTTTEVRGDDNPIITGHAAVFFRADDPGTEFEVFPGMIERIMPGAFTRAIKEDDILAVVNHNFEQMLGRNSSGTLRLSEDDKGLFFEIDQPDTTLGRDTATSIRRGDFAGSSFAFNVDRQEFRDEGDRTIRDLHELSLADVGPVARPAYLSATAGLRSADTADARQAFESFQAEKKRPGIDHFRRRLRFAEMTAGNRG